MSDDVAACAICGAPSATKAGDPVPAASETAAAGADQLPPVELCDEHWAAYRTDWLLLGWCVDHYGEALTHCPQHHRQIEPL